MMEAQAIEKLNELFAAASDINPNHQSVAFVPCGGSLQSLEQFMEMPMRMRQSFSTARIPDFIGYVTGNKSDTTTVYVKPDASCAVAIIDHGRPDYPEWGSHKATLALEKTRAFIALEALCAKPSSQQSFIDYLEDWAKDGVAECLINGEEVSASLAIAAIRKVEIKSSASTVHEKSDFSVSQSSVAQLDVRGAAEKMPTHIVLMSPIYTGTEQRDIYCRISITDDSGKPSFRLRIMQAEKHFEELSKEVESKLRTALEGVNVFVGQATR